MGLYRDLFLPWVIEHAMARPPLTAQRPIVLSQAAGDVLEIGFGTGRNLPFYPPQVQRLTVLEPNAAMARYAAPRLAASPIPVTATPLPADGSLPFDADQFDTVVSTWTLCTIPDPAAALGHIHRVLKPGGKLLFIEHGRCPEPRLARWQRWANPVIGFLGGGCRLDRDIAALIEDSPLHIKSLEQFYLDDTPRIGGYTSRGSALKS
jgi:SAM-dependent methyltransferase